MGGIVKINTVKGYPSLTEFFKLFPIFIHWYHFVERKPETKKILYITQPYPEEYGRRQYPIFAYSGRRGVLMIPATGTRYAKEFTKWKYRNEFLRQAALFILSQKTGGFITALDSPEKVTAGKRFPFTVTVLNGENKPEEYDVVSSVYNWKKTRILEEKKKHIRLRAKQKADVPFSLCLPIDFPGSEGEYHLITYIKNTATGEILHSLSKKIKINIPYSITINKGGGLTYTDSSDAEIDISTTGASGNRLELSISYHGKNVYKESEVVKNNLTSFQWNTKELPYGEYNAEINIYDNDKIIVSSKKESLFLIPDYVKEDFKIGIVWWYWCDRNQIIDDLKKMHRLGMSVIRGNFVRWPLTEAYPPVFRCKSCQKTFTLDDLRKNGGLSLNPDCIFCGSKKVKMERQYDFSCYPNYPLPHFLRYRIEVVPLITNTRAPRWIYNFFKKDKTITHYMWDQNDKINTRYHPHSYAHEECRRLETDWIKALVENVEKKYGKIILGYQVENEPVIAV